MCFNDSLTPVISHTVAQLRAQAVITEQLKVVSLKLLKPFSLWEPVHNTRHKQTHTHKHTALSHGQISQRTEKGS